MRVHLTPDAAAFYLQYPNLLEDLILDALVTQPALRSPSAIEKVQQYFRAHFTENLRFADVARKCGVGHHWLEKNFSKETGTTMSLFVQKLRIERAKIILLDGKLRIGTVRSRSGFQSSTAFYRAFEREVGMSPTEFRKATRKCRSSKKYRLKKR